MHKLLAQWFGNTPDAAAQAEDSGHLQRLASAVLMVEVMRADFSTDTREREAVVRQLRERFALEAEEASLLLDLAEDKADASVSLYEFTSLLNQHFDARGKIQVMEQLWQVALADDRLDAHEEHLIRRISDMLHVPHHEFIRTRVRVSEQREQDND